jgi:hypothetical protein
MSGMTPIQPPFMTYSEQVFATYLDNHGYAWDYEPEIEGQTSRPDFRIRHAGVELLCDVKQRDPTVMPEGGACIDPVGKVRDMLHRAIKQIAGFDDHLCTVALYNHGDYETRLDPFIIYGAMFGQPGFTFDVSTETGQGDPDSTRSVFLPRGGKMVKHYNPLELRNSPQNISAAIAIELHSPPNPEYERASKEAELMKIAEVDRALTFEEDRDIMIALLRQMRSRLEERPRLVTCLNPYARHPFPKEQFFRGEYDEQWEIIDGRQTRTFLGPKVVIEPDDE